MIDEILVEDGRVVGVTATIKEYAAIIVGTATQMEIIIKGPQSTRQDNHGLAINLADSPRNLASQKSVV